MMQREVDPKQGFKLGKIKLEVTRDKLVGDAGLGTIIELFDSSPLSKEFAKCLPKRVANNSRGSYRLGLMMLASLIHGDDCLDDIEEEFCDNLSAEAFFKGKIPVAKTFGDLLRDFEDEHIEALSQFLTTMGYALRKDLNKNLEAPFTPNEKPTFSVDSTVHEQHGDKIEGCDFNYNGIWCLNSEVVYDELGLAYAGKLQTGTTKPGVDGPKLLDQVLVHLRKKKISVPFEKLAHVNGDSAYGFEEFIRVAQSHHASFTVAARKNIPWEEQIEKITDWIEWKYSAKDMAKYSRRNKPLPPRFLGRWHWSPSWAPNLKFPIIIKREWKEDPVFEGCGSWHHHAVITNEDLHLHSYQEVYERYLLRANMENFIKEAKVNLDAYHLPCLSFRANHAFLLLILIAQNILRWVSLSYKPDKPMYAKKLRRKFVFQPGKLVKHAGQLTLKISQKFKQEVESLKERLGLNSEKSPQLFSTA
ncbi:MAG: IS1380 family transposase [Bdellovibrionales bacterium]